MDPMFRLSEHQLERIRPFFHKSRGVSRGDESKVLSGSISVLRNGLPWVDAQPLMDPTQPSTTAAAAGGIRVSLTFSLNKGALPRA